MKKSYTINGKKYHQQPLVIGQLARLLGELKGVKLVDLSPMGLISAFGEKLPRLLACVLIPEDQKVQEIDLDGLAAELWEVDIDTALEVAADFLSMASLASLLEKIEKMMAEAKAQQSGQRPSVPPSPAAAH